MKEYINFGKVSFKAVWEGKLEVYIDFRYLWLKYGIFILLIFIVLIYVIFYIKGRFDVEVIVVNNFNRKFLFLFLFNYEEF